VPSVRARRTRSALRRRRERNVDSRDEDPRCVKNRGHHLRRHNRSANYRNGVFGKVSIRFGDDVLRDALSKSFKDSAVGRAASSRALLNSIQRNRWVTISITGSFFSNTNPPLLLGCPSRAIAAQNFFFIYAHGRRRKLYLGYRVVCGEQQYSTSGLAASQPPSATTAGWATATSTSIGARPSVLDRIASTSLPLVGSNACIAPSFRLWRAAPQWGRWCATASLFELADHKQLQSDRSAANDQYAFAAMIRAFLHRF